MIRHLFVITIFINFAAITASWAKAEDNKANINIQTWQTPEGAKVLFSKSSGSNIVDIRLVFDAASSRDGNKFGIASFVSSMLGKGSKKYTEEQIIAGFNATGAIFSASSLKDMAIVSLRSLSRRQPLKKNIRLFTEVITNPVFNKKVFNRIKKNYLYSIKIEKGKPGTLVEQAFISNIFAQHPYAHNIIGTSISIKNIKIADIREFYKKYYVAKNLTIAIVGDISRVRAKSITRQITYKLTIGKKPQKIAKIVNITPSTTININYTSTQSHIMLGKIGINRENSKYYALYLANHILGGNQLNSKLSYVIREQNGLAYSVYSYFLPMREKGYFAIRLQTKNLQASKAKELVFTTLDEFIKQEINIEDAKNHLIGSFALRVATNQQIVSYLAVIGFYNLDINYLQNFPKKITSLTKSDVKDAIKSFFNDNNWVIVSVGGNK